MKSFIIGQLEDNMKADLKTLEYEAADWLSVAHDKVYNEIFRELGNKLQRSIKTKIFLD
jgi:hypothetical protein